MKTKTLSHVSSIIISVVLANRYFLWGNSRAGSVKSMILGITPFHLLAVSLIHNTIGLIYLHHWYNGLYLWRHRVLNEAQASWFAWRTFFLRHELLWCHNYIFPCCLISDTMTGQGCQQRWIDYLDISGGPMAWKCPQPLYQVIKRMVLKNKTKKIKTKR